MKTVLSFLACALVAAALGDPSHYSLTVLPLPSDATDGYGYAGAASGIDANGDVVGQYTAAFSGGFGSRAFVYANGVARALDGDSVPSAAFGINDSGIAAGFKADNAVTFSNGSYAIPPTSGRSEARGVNGGGTIVGTQNMDAAARAFSYSPGGFVRDLGTLGGDESYGYGVNDAGQIVGFSATADGFDHAFLSDGAAMRDLGTLGGATSMARAISSGAVAVGFSDLSGGGTHAFAYEGGAMRDLGTLGDANSFAYGVNGGGQVVGSLVDPNTYRPRGALFVDGAVYDLTALLEGADGYTVANAYGINDSGLIVGSVFDAAGVEHAGLLTPLGGSNPVPEPAAWTVLGLGALALRRRRA